jgi:DNA-binding MarR family transcriptional regulator
LTKLKVDSQEGYKLWVAIDAVYHNLMRGREQEFAEVKIKPMHAVVIAVIKNGSGALSPAQISRRIFREPNSTSQLISRMEEKGLVKRKRENGSKRRFTVELTEKGENVYKITVQRKSFIRTISRLTSFQRAKLFTLLQDLWKSSQIELGLDPSGSEPWRYPRPENKEPLK